MSATSSSGSECLRPVLEGVRVIELAGIGPAPFCGMMLADHGAEVIRIDRPGGSDPLAQNEERDVLLRSRRTITLDLKDPKSVEIVSRLVETADGIIEGFRPGVAEKLGLGPEAMMKLNPALVYGRMTGWGQQGPMSSRAGHDLNYISMTGCLASLGPAGSPPSPPLNLVGDFGGGGMLLAFGFVSALLAARSDGKGRVIDCAMVDGTAALMAAMWSLKHNDIWEGDRGKNLLDGGAPFYACYECADGRFVALGAIESKFYDAFLAAMDLESDPLFANQHDRERWPQMKDRLREIFASAPRAVWAQQLADIDCCFTEVLTQEEAVSHEHSIARSSYLEADGYIQSKPAPRFEGTRTVEPRMWRRDADREALLAEIGMSDPASQIEIRKHQAER